MGGLRVAFDAGPTLEAPTGVGRYARELGAALERHGIDLVRFAISARGRSDPAMARWRVPARAAQWSWRRFGAPSIHRLVGDVDVVHGTNFVLPAGGGHGAVTIHDLSFHRNDVFPGGRRLRELVPWSLRRASRVLVPTQSVAQEVTARYSWDAERVSVTPEGVSPLFFGATPLSDAALAGMGIQPPFAVAVGTIEPRKNLHRLLAAWEAARSSLAGWTLVLAGPRGWGRALPPTPAVVLPGWVGDETLPGLLAAAEVFCYPSLYEGFGLPPLEAMAAGTPVVAGAYPAAREVLGDAAVIVDPTDTDAIADALVRLATDGALRSQMTVAGRAHASLFTWDRTALATVDAYRRIVQG